MDSALGSPLHPDDDDDQEWDNELPTPNDRRALFWLNYEPDIDELEFLWQPKILFYHNVLFI